MTLNADRDPGAPSRETEAYLRRQIRELKQQLTEAHAQLTQRSHNLSEAHEYQTAISEVLEIISRSTVDLRSVLDTVAAAAARLCDAALAAIAIRQGEVYRYVALFSVNPEWDRLARRLEIVPGPETVAGRTILSAQTVHIADLAADPEYAVPEAVSIGGLRTTLGVPLLREGQPIGVIVVARHRVEPFSERQVAAIRTFADQSVIAMENARLIAETREALEQQTATAEVLGVINSSPGDLAPVFDAMVGKAIRLCEAACGHLLTYDGQHVTPAAARGTPEYTDYMRRVGLVSPGIDTPVGRALRGEPVVHIIDAREEEIYRTNEGFREQADMGGFRSMLVVGLRREDTFLGTLTVFRQEVRPFSDNHIALLQNFAAQAVIAMENARLLTETREALEQQTATAEVLRVINSSPGDLEPVFDAMLEKAMRLCQAWLGHITTFDGKLFHHSAIHGDPDVVSFFRSTPALRASQHSISLGQIVDGASFVHIADCTTTAEYRERPIAREVVDRARMRTLLTVPLRKNESLLGTIHIYRQEVRKFSDKQIGLLQNFAAQAVIAMENARLINETREALEQQTATAEVLQVINSSPGDLAPVFDALLEKAMQLCEAAFGGLTGFDGERFHTLATRGLPEEAIEAFREPWIAGEGSYHQNLVCGEGLVHTDFGATDQARQVHRQSRAIMEIGKARTGLIIALRKDDRLIGSLFFYRQEVRPFTGKQIALLQNFAAQAVIAMENARLLTETREALEQQTATAEILRVISGSPTDVQPTFDAIIANASRLCEAEFSAVARFEDGLLHLVATNNLSAEESAAFHGIFPRPPARNFVMGRAFIDARPIQFDDVLDDTGYDERARLVLQAKLGYRTFMAVPIFRDGAPIGVIGCARRQVKAFTETQIQLLTTFAEQAAIALDNVRLFTQLRERTDDLQESLEYQTATSDVLKVISRSTFDLQPVLQTLVEMAVRLCEADFGHLCVPRDDSFRPAATFAFSPDFDAVLRKMSFTPGRGTGVGRVLLERRTIHIPNIKRDPDYGFQEAVTVGNVHSILNVPLLRGDEIIGVISFGRERVEPFTDRQIELISTFADQAVIAIENTRLLTELRESLEQQQAMAEVLGVINSSPGDLAPVFDAILEKGMNLCRAAFGILLAFDGKRFSHAALRSIPTAYAEFMREHPPTYGAETAPGRLAAGEPLVHVIDMTDTDSYRSGDPNRRAIADLAGARTLVAVPLRTDDALLGAIVVFRQEVRPFSEKQVALLQNFAAQAVIAMENARLITETREALEQQTATAEVLQVINSSPGDLVPVFDAMLDRATRLCDASYGLFWIYDGRSFRVLAGKQVPNALMNFLREPQYPEPDTGIGRLVGGEPFVNFRDLSEYRGLSPVPHAVANLGGARSGVVVGLQKDGTLIGAISVYRQEVQPFTEKQIGLLQNFAAQAVIAMDNARLLNEIRQRQSELRVTFDNMGDGVAMFDADLCLAAWNMNFQQILDLPDELLAARPTLTDFVRHLAERGEFGTVDTEVEVRRLTERAGTQWSAERTRPDGCVIEVRNNPVPGGGFVLIYSDVTDRKRAEAEIRAARDAAEKALGELRAAQASLIQAEKMASLGQLTAGIAHEIKNPLNFVNNFAGLSVELLDELKGTAAPAFHSLDDDRRSEVDETIELLSGNLEKIAEHGRRADNIVKSMLEHSRGVSGERREVDLNALVDEALNLAYHGARAQDASFNITMERDFDKSLQAIELAPQEITRVFLNLFSNGFYAATKRQKQGDEPGFKPTLHVSTRDLGDVVEVRVRDNGTGIPPEIRDKLFQPFFTTKPTGEGTGLGLSISYDIVTQQHGGAIEVESDSGQFTEFTVRLPRAHTSRAAA